MGTQKHHLLLPWVARQYAQGCSARQLAKHYGVAPGTILRQLREAGYPTRQYHRAVTVQDVLRIYDSGLSHEGMARLLGTSSSTVGRLLAQAKLPSWGHAERSRLAAERDDSV